MPQANGPNDPDDIELVPINAGTSSSAAPSVGRYSHRRPTGGLARACAGHPRAQIRLWIGVSVLVLVAAGVAFAVQAAARRHGAPAAAGAFLAPGVCALLLPASRLGPEALLHTPLSYALALDLSRPEFYRPGGDVTRFQAAANCTLHVLQDTSCLNLHASNLSFTSITASLLVGAWSAANSASAALQHAGGSSPVCLCGAGPDCLTRSCEQLLQAQPGSTTSWVVSLGPLVAPAGSTLLLATTYTAAFQQRQGLWRTSPYPSALLTTDLEMEGARMVLPCMDVPGLKATFVVQVLAPPGLTVLSNAPEASSTTTGQGRLVTFLPTPPMSTYLLAIVVGELQAVEANTTDGHLVRVWAVPERVQDARAPLRLAVSALQHYTNYTGISQAQAWDLVAVPDKTGAVENWGLVLFDPERLLLPSPSSAWALFRSADVICHELGHQWYGNLVTAATWPDLLVNEGLASLVEYGCLARVLQQQLGESGAALLMHQMAAAPAGWAPGVHEGPLANTLAYDASPLAQPLLGSGVVEFAVPVYSKAASVMAMMALYAVLGGEQGPAQQAAMQLGPLPALARATSPPGLLQAALQQHLRQHAYGTATAIDVLSRIVGLAPAEVSDNTLAVITGWQAPGSPLMLVNVTEQGLVVRQTRFCTWGLLQDKPLQQALAPAQDSKPRVAPPSATDSALLCPTAADGRDRAVPWTPVLLRQLPRAAINSTSEDAGAPQQAACMAWHVLRNEVQQLTLADGCAGGSVYVLEGDGGWGLFRTAYGSQQRAASRAWVAADLPVLLSTDQAPQLLTTASKLLQDQAALALSAFADGGVPGGEVLAALQAAVNATSAVQQLAKQRQEGERGGPVGTALHALILPLLPAVDVLLDRLAVSKSCALQTQSQVAALLRPVAQTALAAFAPAGTANSSSMHGTRDQLLGGMALNRLLWSAATVEPGVAGTLCQRFNFAAARAAGSAPEAATDADVLLRHIHPDLHSAVLSVAAAQPAGCRLDWTSDQVYSTLRQWLVASRDPRVSNLAAFALASLPARDAASPVTWQQTLELLLGLGSSTSGLAARASGVPPARHAVEVMLLLSRAVGSAGTDLLRAGPAGTGSISSAVSHPVTAFLAGRWQSVTAALGDKEAWVLLREAAAREVLTEGQWLSLAAWVAAQATAAAGNGTQPYAAVLGAAWSTVVWVSRNRRPMCGD